MGASRVQNASCAVAEGYVRLTDTCGISIVLISGQGLWALMLHLLYGAQHVGSGPLGVPPDYMQG